MLIIKNTLEEIEDINYSIKDLNITDIVPNSIDNYIVYIDEEGHHSIHLPLNETGPQFKIWKNGRGGIFSKDVLDFCLNRFCGKYLHIKGQNINYIVRLITDDEEHLFKSLKLIDGKIKDIPYMILRSLGADDHLTSIKKSITDKDFIFDEETINIIPIKITINEDFEPHIGSISLFNE